ncbi:MAG: C_GCAxxG_C_C family protein [Clostridiales bacterium]|nr:C_GCAxxG_C_C family protein [Clostridiales bacterium]
MDKGQLAYDLFHQGYNCAQAVLLAFAEDCGISEKAAAKIASSFGGGVGRLREVCGAVSGMCMAAGLLKGYSDAGDVQGRSEHYARIQQMAGEFREKFGSIVCRDLLSGVNATTGGAPEERTAEYYKKRSCDECVRLAAEIAEKYLLND